MPCDSRYMEASELERERQRAAQLLGYVYQSLRKPIPAWVEKTAASYYGEPDGDLAIQKLCEMVRGLSPGENERILYDAHSKKARDLANWWERHKEADRKREAEEQAEARRKILHTQALAKLSPEEREALGVQ